MFPTREAESRLGPVSVRQIFLGFTRWASLLCRTKAFPVQHLRQIGFWKRGQSGTACQLLGSSPQKKSCLCNVIYLSGCLYWCLFAEDIFKQAKPADRKLTWLILPNDLKGWRWKNTFRVKYIQIIKIHMGPKLKFFYFLLSPFLMSGIK